MFFFKKYKIGSLLGKGRKGEAGGGWVLKGILVVDFFNIFLKALPQPVLVFFSMKRNFPDIICSINLETTRPFMASVAPGSP